VEKKARFIAQLETGNTDTRTAEDIGGGMENAAAATKAVSTSDPRYVEQVGARTAKAVAAAQRSQHAAAWETQAAAQAAEKVLAYAGRMDAAVSAAATPPAAPPAPDDGLTDAERKVRDVMDGRRAKTIRQIVDTAATSTTRADRGQGGKKPDRGRGGQHR